MYKLYWARESGALAPQAALEEVGADYQRIVLDLEAGDHRKPDFLAVNPRGQVPALTLPDGTVMTESAAMLLQIADCHPESALLPPPGEPARAEAYRWLLFCAVNLYESDLRLYYPARYTTEDGGEAGVKQAALRDFDLYLDMLEKVVGTRYFLGESFSVVDLYLLMVVQWHPEVEALFARCPALEALCARVRARPSVERIWTQHYPG